MALDRCIPGMVERGEITPEQAADMGSLYGELHQEFRRQFGDQSAAAMATDATLRQMAALAQRKRMLAGRAITAQKAMLADLPTYNGGRGMDGNIIDPRAAQAMISGDDRAPFSSVDGRRAAIERRAFSMISGMLQQFHTDVLGRVRHTAELTDVLRAHWGEKVDNLAATELATALGRSFEYVRTRFNAAGGDIGTLPGGRGYLPQNHDWMLVRRAGYENWRAAILPELDRAAMIDRRTGMAFSDEALELALRDVFETIRTDGWDRAVPGQVMGGGMTANRRGDPRFLLFRTADGWMRYNEQFGRNTPWDAILLHIKSMARDTAAMERFGPNPEHGVRWLRDTMVQRAARVADDGSALTKAEAGALKLDRDWAEYTGANRRVANQKIANVGRAVRAFETSAKMGSALLSAVPGDIATQHFTAAFNKLPATRIMAHQLALLNPANAEHRQLAASMGLMFDNWLDNSAAAMRSLGSDMDTGRMARVANTVLRAQGLGWWTDSGNAAFGMTVFEHMATMRAAPFDQLDDGFADMLRRNGIGAGEWDRLRATAPREVDGNGYIVPEDVTDSALGDRVLEMIHDEQRLAVQVADFRTRALMNENLRPGTIVGEVARTSLLFKSFGVSMLMMHGQRMAAMSNWRSRASYGLRMLTTLTIMGAVAIQLREIAKGRDPRPMDDPALWASASLQGGGFGMVGDLLQMTTNPRLDNVGTYLAGPAGDSVMNLAALPLYAAGQDAHYAATGEGHGGHLGEQLVKSLQSELPGGNLWYTRLAVQRLWMDQLQAQIDPDYEQSWARMEQRAAEQRNGYYWQPGDTTPDRAPDIMNIMPDNEGQPEEVGTMTAAALTPSIDFNGNGVTRAFALPFRFRSPEHVQVRLITAGVVAVLAYGADYSVTGGTTDSGGVATLTVAPALGTVVRFVRVTPRAQTMNYTTADVFPAESHELALDTAMLIDQEQDVGINALSARSYQLPEGESANPLPSLASRVSRLFGWDALGAAVALTYAQLATLIAPFLPASLKGAKGDPGANVMSIGPRSGIGGQTIGAGTAMVMVSGGAVAGDQGHGPMLLDAEQVATTARGLAIRAAATGRGQSAGTAQTAVTAMESRFRMADAAGRWFRRAKEEAQHMAYALPGDSVTDTVQASQDLASTWNLPHPRIGDGGFAMDRSLWVTRGDDFRVGKLKGMGQAYNGQVLQSSTLLTFSDFSAPGVIFQGYRLAEISDITISGPGRANFLLCYLGGTNPRDTGGNAIDDFYIATWRTEGGFTHYRFAPCAGVVDDPLVGTVPVGGSGTNRPYSFPTAQSQPDWLGPLALYNRSSSSQMKLEKVEITGWDVGICINPSGTNFQTDYTTGERCVITFCCVALSVGNDQSRAVNWPDFNAALCHTFVTNRMHGQQAGQIGGTIHPTVGAAIRLLDIDLSRTGSLTIQDFYAESMLYIGDVDCGTIAGNGSLLFVNGAADFAFHPPQRGSPPYLLGPTASPGGGINFLPVQFSGGKYRVHQIAPLLANVLTLNGTVISVTEALNGYWEAAALPEYAILDDAERKRRKMAYNGTAGLATPRFAPADHRIIFAPIDIDGSTAAFIGVMINTRPYAATSRATGIPHWQEVAQPWSYLHSEFQDVAMPRRPMNIAKSAFTGMTRTGRRWTGTLVATYRGANEWRGRINNIAPGRVCYDRVSGTSFWICSIDYTTGVTVMEAMHNYYRPIGASVDSHRLAVNMASGDSLDFIETGFYMHACSLIGDVTAGSNTVTNLRRPEDGDFAWLTNATYAALEPQAGDWLYYDDRAPGAFPFVQAAARITAFNGAARTMTMAGNSGVTAVGVPFPLFRRGG